MGVGPQAMVADDFIMALGIASGFVSDKCLPDRPRCHDNIDILKNNYAALSVGNGLTRLIP
jgi:hypothetical protein